MLRAVAIALFVLVAVTARTAAADEQSALVAYRHGEDAFKAGDFRSAAQSFEAAFRQDPRGASIYNAALAWASAGDDPRAADDFALAIATPDLPDGFANEARSRLAALERSLARVDVTAPSGARITLAHAKDANAPAHVHVAPGTYEIRVVFADGRTRAKTIAALAGRAMVVDVEPPAPVAVAPVPSAAPVTTEAPEAPQPRSSRRTFAWIALGGAAVAGAAGIYFYVDARNTRDDYVAKHDATGAIDTSLHDSAQSALVRSWIAGGVAVAAAATGVVLFLTEPDAPRTSASIRFGVTPGGAVARGSF
jgi:tetratricopeptide (TPR) repeat protein